MMPNTITETSGTNKARSQHYWKLPISFQGGKRDWNWHASEMFVDGSLPMPASILDPSLAPLADANGMVDVAPLGGSGVWMLMRGVKRLLKISTGWDIFQDAVNLPTRTIGHRTYYQLDPADRMRDIYQRWEAKLRVPANQREFNVAKRFYRFASPPPDVFPPRAVITGAIRQLGTRLPKRSADLSQYMLVRDEQRRTLITAIRAEMSGETPPESPCRTKSGAPSEDEMVARVHFLGGLPMSCVATDNPKRYPGPDATSRGRLAKIENGFVPAAFFVYGRSAAMRHPEMMPRYLRAYDRFIREALAENPAFDISSQPDVIRAQEHFAFGELIVTQVTRQRRDFMLREARGVMRHARTIMLAFDPDDAKGIRSQAPAEHSDPESFLRRVAQAYGEDRERYGETRAKFANKVKNAYRGLIATGHRRTAQIRADGEAARAAMDILSQPDMADFPYWDFDASGPELTEAGRATGLLQTRWYRLWRVADACLSLTHDRAWRDEPPTDVWHSERLQAAGARVKLRRAPSAEALEAEPRFHGTGFVVEFLECTRDTVERKPAIAPFYVTIASNMALTGGGLLTPDQQERRAATIKRFSMPAYCDSGPGMMGFEDLRAWIARTAAREDRANRRTFIPLEEMEHAFRFAMHGVDAVDQTWCRRAEFMQQVEWGDAWTLPDSDAYGWYCSRKLSRKQSVLTVTFMECNEQHYENSVDLLALTKRRCRYDPEETLPLVPPPSDIAWKLSEEGGPFVFSFAGRCLSFKELSYYLGVLYTNVGTFRFHDLRAGRSNEARWAEGASREEVGAGLGDSTAAVVDMYSALTQEQIHEDLTAVQVRKRQRIEDDIRQRRGAS